MVKDVYPHWPEIDAATLQAIGRFVVTWGVLEGHISGAITDLYDFDHTVGLSVTANLGTKAKLELFMSGVSLYEEWFSSTVDIRDMNKLANDTANVANKHRNMLAHGQPIPIHLENDDNMFPKYDWLWTRISARKGGVKMTAHHLNRYPFEIATNEAIQLIDRWTQFRLDASYSLELRRSARSFLQEQSDEPDH